MYIHICTYVYIYIPSTKMDIENPADFTMLVGESSVFFEATGLMAWPVGISVADRWFKSGWQAALM